MRERANGRTKIAALQDMSVPKGTALPPEDNEDIKALVTGALKAGSVASADGGKAVKSSVKASADGAVPLIYARHGKKPVPQFTTHTKLNSRDLAPELVKVLTKHGRIKDGSSSVRFVGGNQSAESVWGTNNQLLKQRCLHRGKSRLLLVVCLNV